MSNRKHPLSLKRIRSIQIFFHMAKQTRLIKLHGKYQTVKDHWNGGRDVPWLNISGLWLEQAGFKVGDQLEIVVGRRVLKIKKKAAHGDTGH